jgi:hypothetical protein
MEFINGLRGGYPENPPKSASIPNKVINTVQYIQYSKTKRTRQLVHKYSTHVSFLCHTERNRAGEAITRRRARLGVTTLTTSSRTDLAVTLWTPSSALPTPIVYTFAHPMWLNKQAKWFRTRNRIIWNALIASNVDLRAFNAVYRHVLMYHVIIHFG